MVELFGNGLPSDIGYPFKLECIDSITIRYDHYIFSGKPYFKGIISFVNGNTKGSHEVEGENLVDVFMKVMEFCKSL